MYTYVVLLVEVLLLLVTNVEVAVLAFCPSSKVVKQGVAHICQMPGENGLPRPTLGPLGLGLGTLLRLQLSTPALQDVLLHQVNKPVGNTDPIPPEVGLVKSASSVRNTTFSMTAHQTLQCCLQIKLTLPA